VGGGRVNVIPYMGKEGRGGSVVSSMLSNGWEGGGNVILSMVRGVKESLYTQKEMERVKGDENGEHY